MCTSNQNKFDSPLNIKCCHRQKFGGQAHKGFTKACQKREDMISIYYKNIFQQMPK